MAAEENDHSSLRKYATASQLLHAGPGELFANFEYVFHCRPTHSGLITCLAFSADGELLVTGSQDWSAKIWHAQRGVQLLSLEGHRAEITAIAISHRANLIATASADRTVRLWQIDWRAGTSCPLPFLWNLDSPINALTFSKDGNRVATGSAGGVVAVWNVRERGPSRTFSAHSAAVSSVVFSDSAALLCSGGYDGLVNIWNLGSDTNYSIAVDSGAVLAIALTRNADACVIASSDNSVQIRDIVDGHLRAELGQRLTRSTCVGISPEGSYLAFSLADRDTSLVGVEDGEAIAMSPCPPSDPTALAVASAGRAVAVSCVDRSVRIWNGQGQAVKTIEPLVDGLTSVAVSGLGDVVAGLSHRGSITLWCGRTGTRLQRITSQGSAPTQLAFSGSGEFLATVSADGAVWIYHWQGGTPAEIYRHGSVVTAAAFASECQMLAIAGADGRVVVLDVLTGGLITEQSGYHSDRVSGIALTARGDFLVTGSYDRSIKIWSNKKHSLVDCHNQSPDIVTAVSVAAKANVVGFAGVDGMVTIWRPKQGFHRLMAHESPVTSIAISNRGDVMVTGAADRHVRIWNTLTRELIVEATDHTDTVTAVAISRDGRRVFSASLDGTIKVWNTSTGQLLATFLQSVSGGWMTWTIDGYYIGEVLPTQVVMEYCRKGVRLPGAAKQRENPNPSMVAANLTERTIARTKGHRNPSGVRSLGRPRPLLGAASAKSPPAVPCGPTGQSDPQSEA